MVLFRTSLCVIAGCTDSLCPPLFGGGTILFLVAVFFQAEGLSVKLPPRPLNHITIFVDAISRAMFFRRLPKTARRLASIQEDGTSSVFQFFRYVSVGPNTKLNTRALYLGWIEDEPEIAGRTPTLWEEAHDRGSVQAHTLVSHAHVLLTLASFHFGFLFVSLTLLTWWVVAMGGGNSCRVVSRVRNSAHGDFMSGLELLGTRNPHLVRPFPELARLYARIPGCG